MKNIKKILIANRGEIAIRIACTARKMGIEVTGVFASDDTGSAHVPHMDDSVDLGSGPVTHTYLNIEKIIRAAKEKSCDAIHPGYGFLSENHRFAEICHQNGIIFIGPEPSVIKLLGNKIKALEYVKSIGIPVLESFPVDLDSVKRLNGEIRYPVIVKASAGGGGKAMRLVRSKNELVEAVETAIHEANSYFDDSEVFWRDT
ncbi:MAG: hypothetical protein HC906_02535 [Bacteroidales bacterium]|nr:hypothetical protein [Bacteroidales bacterium]